MQISTTSISHASLSRTGSHKLEAQTGPISPSSTVDPGSLDTDTPASNVESNLKIEQTGWKEDPLFQDVMKRLDSKQQSQLIDVITTLNGSIPGILVPSGKQLAQDFMNALVADSGNGLSEGASRMLDEASGMAAQVLAVSDTSPYQPGKVVTLSLETTAQLSNFIQATAGAEDSAALMDQVESFGGQHQDTLYQLIAMDREGAESLMTQLAERSDETKDAVLNLFHQQLDFKSAPFFGLEERVIAQVPDDVKGRAGVAASYYDSNPQVVKTMVQDTLQLMEDYAFSDEQLTHLAGQLRGMDAASQRAALAITVTGMDTLLGGAGEGQQLDLSEHEDVLETLDALRTDSQVLEVVAKSRLGEPVSRESGDTFYSLKGYGESLRDQQNVVNLLVTDAWVNNQLPQSNDVESQSQRLANWMIEMGADNRDAFAQALTEQIPAGLPPLAELSEDALRDTLDGFQNRTSSIASSDNLAELFIVEEQIASESREDFWTATHAAGEEIDSFVQTLKHQSEDIQLQLLDTIALQQAKVDAGEQSQGELQKRLSQVISQLDSLESDTDKSALIKHTF